MRITNIRTVMVFREVAGEVYTLEQIQAQYPIRPHGTLTYYGIGDVNVENFRATGLALNDNHRAVLDNLLDWLASSPLEQATFELVAGPTSKDAPFAYVEKHLDLIDALASNLAEYQKRASSLGKSLNIALRYASEMNASGDANAVYAGDPGGFKKSFAHVREVFAGRAPQIVFPFAPALRADLDVDAVAPYWPGDTYVDLIGATWYIHGERQYEAGIANMKAYFERYRSKNKPFAIDEFGGAEGSGRRYYSNDSMLKKMLHEIESMKRAGMAFEFATLFLDDRKYGVDATLDFLN